MTDDEKPGEPNPEVTTPTSMPEVPKPDGVADFADAMAELEAIVDDLESDDLDVDHLAERVERAAVLVAWCRFRLDGARFQVTEILDHLDEANGA